MFSKETYVSRRNELKKMVKDGVILLFGNNESPANYPNNGTILSARTPRSCITSDRSATDW